MAKNSLGREIPTQWQGRRLIPYSDPWSRLPEGSCGARPLARPTPGGSKLLPSLRQAMECCGLQDGMTISTHHHLRNGDLLLNLIVRELDRMGLRDMRIASSSVHPVHAEIIPFIQKGVVTRIETGVNGLIGELISKGALDCPTVVRSHGGRARSIISGETVIDAAFIAAPSCDPEGNLSGLVGPSACGSLGYAHTDARYARKVVAVTDHLVPYPNIPFSISQCDVDHVVRVESLGDPQKIISTTTRVTREPIGMLIARQAADVIEASGLIKDGFSFQTGAGGTSLAVAEHIRHRMSQGHIKGSFGCGGITGFFVEMLEEGSFDALFDVQCFDLRAVDSMRRNARHVEIGADLYANPFNRGSIVDKLDCVILGATEVDVDFNVNVNTESSGYLLHNTGGHCDTAAGAKLSIVVAPSMRGRIPTVRGEVTTITTPGATVDVVITERGICVSDRHSDLRQELLRRHLPVKDIHQVCEEVMAITGVPRPIEFHDEVVALIEYRDGSIIDVVRRVRE